MNSSLGTMEQMGYFRQQNELQMHSRYLPWLYEEVYDKLMQITAYSEAVSWMA
jgi:hypothetical protein